MVENAPVTGHDEDPDGDWAPLPPERQVLQPGELDDPRPGVVPEELLAPPPPAPKPKPKPRNVRGERMLAELQQRVARLGRSDSLVSGLQRREQRSARAQRRADQVRPELEGQFVAGQVPGAPADEPPTEPQLELARDCDVDPWFVQLPEHEQQRLRAAWSEERHRFDWTGRAARARLVRAAAYGAAMFTANAVLLIMLTGDPWRFLYYAPVGAIAAVAAQACGGTRFHYMVAGALGFTVVDGANLLRNPFMMYGLLLSIATMAVIGMDREMRNSAGQRDA